MAKTDLFTWLDAVWSKKRPEGIPPVFMLHRFLASDQMLAEAARTLQQDIRRLPDLTFGIWQALVPKATRAPRLAYVAAKKAKAAEELTTRMMSVLGESRRVVEDMHAIIYLEGRLLELYTYFGVECPAELKPKDTSPPKKRDKKPLPPTSGGLLDTI
jgi:hypothetical protein